MIRLKSNAKLQRLADVLHPSTGPSDVTKSESYYEETKYREKSWSKSRKVMIQSVRPAGELFFTHAFFVTNLIDAVSPKDIVQFLPEKRNDEKLLRKLKMVLT